MLVVCLGSLLFTGSFFVLLILSEAILIVTFSLLVSYGLGPWLLLPLLGIGAREASVGLAHAIALSRVGSPSQFHI